MSEIAEATGLSAGAIRTDRMRGRWPEPDGTAYGVNRWYGETATAASAGRGGDRRS
ncbi:hypothetical protein GCM10018785_05330 [Streptomyces longispororuber]|uniref:Uncharacterized protein n=1 Tax=Streptomyces longispororuber TaxID=68230 RepID=A0A919DFI6_9ACTN|nr:hypothetical protein [Streptomyces longispororuber]GHE38725.1 hypothetical protein GCM10018785_05330 [Streptomyces longispororuber]